MSFGPPKPFRTWPTVASPQAQKRLDDDAEMIMWLMSLPRRKPEAPEDRGAEDGGLLEPPPQAPRTSAQGGLEPGYTGFPEQGGQFRGLLYEPRVGKGLLNIDPDDPQLRSLPTNNFVSLAPNPWGALPVISPWGGMPRFEETPQ